MSDIPQQLRAVLRGEASGKTVWQPRIECWYSDREYRGEPLPGKYAGDSMLKLYNKLGVSNRLYIFCECVEKYYDAPAIIEETIAVDPMTTKHIIRSPAGEASAVYRKNSSNFGEMPLKWWVETAEDIEALTYIEQHTRYRFNRQTYDRLLAEWGHLGLPCMCMPRVNIQRLLIDLCGVENTFYLLNDEEDAVEELLRAIDGAQLKMADMLRETPFEWINYGDNIHAKVLSPRLFEKYVIPAYQARNQRLQGAGKFTFAHFDGDVKELLPYFQACGLNGIEAVTPLPQGDITLREARAAMDGIFLVDGIAALLFDESYPLDELKRQTLECLELFEGQLVLGISDEMSSTGTLDRIEYVTELVEDFNAKH